MNIQAEKISLIQRLIQVEDEALLLAIKNLLEFGLERQGTPSTDFWDELTEKQKAQVQASIHQLDDGEGIPHDKVMEELRKEYSS